MSWARSLKWLTVLDFLTGVLMFYQQGALRACINLFFRDKDVLTCRRCLQQNSSTGR